MCRHTYATSGPWRLQIIPHAHDSISSFVPVSAQLCAGISDLASAKRLADSASAHAQDATGTASRTTTADGWKHLPETMLTLIQVPCWNLFATDCQRVQTHATLLSIQSLRLLVPLGSRRLLSPGSWTSRHVKGKAGRSRGALCENTSSARLSIVSFHSFSRESQEFHRSRLLSRCTVTTSSADGLFRVSNGTSGRGFFSCSPDGNTWINCPGGRHWTQPAYFGSWQGFSTRHSCWCPPLGKQ